MSPTFLTSPLAESAPADSHASDVRVPKPPDVRFGAAIESLAKYFCIEPADVTLAMAGVLANIAGPYAGFVTPLGNSISPGLNVLRVDADNPTASALEKALMQPLRSHTQYLRTRAKGMSREISDRWSFGPHPMKFANQDSDYLYRGMIEHDVEHTARQVNLHKLTFLPGDLNEESLMPPNYHGDTVDADVTDVSHGVAQLPSLFFESLCIKDIDRALAECVQREALLLNPIGGIFGSGEMLPAKEELLANALASLLAGRDIEFPPVHKDQGRGTFERAKVHLWANIGLTQVGSLLNYGKTGWSDLLENCLLWEACPLAQSIAIKMASREAWRIYLKALNGILEARCFANLRQQRRSRVSPQDEATYEKFRHNHTRILEQVDSGSKSRVRQFHDLPERLMWLLTQLFCPEEMPHLVETAFHTAAYAVQKHLHIIQKARIAEAKLAAARSADKVLAILRRKGPCRLREIQRSAHKVRVSELEMGINRLQEQGFLQIDDQRRLTLVTPQN